MNPSILNRAGKLPDDGWYQIEANGEHVNHAAKVVQVIDAKAVDSIVNRFSVDAQAPNFAGQRIDRDHLSQSMDNPTEALGWAMQLRNRDGIPEAKIDWTSLGQPLVEGKVYKFFSTEYKTADCEDLGTRIINKKTYNVVRPLGLAGLALTNDPNNKGQRPISNRSGAWGLADKVAAECDDISARRIRNRAAEIQNTARTSGRVCSFRHAFNEASNESGLTEEARAGRIKNRALEIQANKSTGRYTYPFAQAFREATSEMSSVR